MPSVGIVSSSSREVPDAPVIDSASNVPANRAYNNGRADVVFTPSTWDGGLPITSYVATSNPGGYTGSNTTTPVSVTGLQSAVSYTFNVVAINDVGNSSGSAFTSAITATTVPQAPTIGTAAAGNTTATVGYTANATGGASITTFTATSSPGGKTGTGASPITVTGLTNGTAYTFTVTATNENGTSAASAASNSITPVAPGPNFPNFVTPNFPNFVTPNFPNFVTPNFPNFVTPNFPNFVTPNFPNFTCAACCQDTGGYYCCGSFQLNACWYQYDPCCGTACAVRVELYGCG